MDGIKSFFKLSFFLVFFWNVVQKLLVFVLNWSVNNAIFHSYFIYAARLGFSRQWKSKEERMLGLSMLLLRDIESYIVDFFFLKGASDEKYSNFIKKLFWLSNLLYMHIKFDFKSTCIYNDFKKMFWIYIHFWMT